MKNVIEMVKAAMCTGCSACLLHCPHDNLTMIDGDLGFPVPHIKDEDLCKGCDECIKACPFSDEADEDDKDDD